MGSFDRLPVNEQIQRLRSRIGAQDKTLPRLNIQDPEWMRQWTLLDRHAPQVCGEYLRVTLQDMKLPRKYLYQAKDEVCKNVSGLEVAMKWWQTNTDPGYYLSILTYQANVLMEYLKTWNLDRDWRCCFNLLVEQHDLAQRRDVFREKNPLIHCLAQALGVRNRNALFSQSLRTDTIAQDVEELSISLLNMAIAHGGCLEDMGVMDSGKRGTALELAAWELDVAKAGGPAVIRALVTVGADWRMLADHPTAGPILREHPRVKSEMLGDLTHANLMNPRNKPKPSKL